MNFVAPTVFDNPKNYKAVSKVLTKEEHKRLDYLTKGLLFWWLL